MPDPAAIRRRARLLARQHHKADPVQPAPLSGTARFSGLLPLNPLTRNARGQSEASSPRRRSIMSTSTSANLALLRASSTCFWPSIPSRSSPSRICDNLGKMNEADFSRGFINAFPYTIHTGLTGNGMAFADLPKNCGRHAQTHQTQPPMDPRSGRTDEPHRQRCHDQGVPLPKPRQPQGCVKWSRSDPMTGKRTRYAAKFEARGAGGTPWRAV